MGLMTVNQARVLVVDDEAHVCRLIEDVLSSDRCCCDSVHSGEEARDRLLRDKYDVAIIDLRLPGVSGMELLNFISGQKLGTRAICITGAATGQSGREALDAGACDFLEKPFDISLLAESVRRAIGCDSGVSSDSQDDFISQQGWADFDRLRRTLIEAAGALVQAVEAKDPYTRRHSDHVAFYAEHIARHVGASEGMIESVRLAGLLHEIGKIAVPDTILTKPGRLSREEFDLIRLHPQVGAEIIENITLMKSEAYMIRHHHENWDGSGYPDGLAGEDIPLGSRILNIADSIDAMLMPRTYKDAYPVERVLEELERCASKQFEPDLARQTVEWCRKNPSKLILPPAPKQAKSA